jgi:RimJ/RimL family protein N-acetyltransferase
MVMDVDETYVNWLNDPIINKHLEVRHNPPTLLQQMKYVSECIESKDKLICGIFSMENRLIGTLKLSFLNSHTAEIGIMIGEKSMQGIGVGKNTISLIKKWSKENNLSKLTAGYEVKNIASAKLFDSLGFKKIETILKPLLTNQTILIERVALDLANVC